MNMLKKLNPLYIKKAFARKYRHRQIIRNFDEKKLEIEQEILFNELGLDYKKTKRVLMGVYNEYPSLVVPMQSAHHNLFAALLDLNPKRIMEIGTNTGAGAALLAILFPAATIYTLDLPDDDPVFAVSSFGIPGKELIDARSEFISKRDGLLSKFKNIKFIQKNSTILTLEKDVQFDFIWVDANHEAPYVCIDTANAIRLLADNGLLACDDIRCGNDPFNVLEQFRSAGVIGYTLIHKRTYMPENVDLAGKYIAVAKKIGNKKNESIFG
jgi:predicted O-methyltransferase YrrM